MRVVGLKVVLKPGVVVDSWIDGTGRDGFLHEDGEGGRGEGGNWRKGKNAQGVGGRGKVLVCRW